MTSTHGPKSRSKFDLSITEGRLRAKIEVALNVRAGWIVAVLSFLAVLSKLLGH